MFCELALITNDDQADGGLSKIGTDLCGPNFSELGDAVTINHSDYRTRYIAQFNLSSSSATNTKHFAPSQSMTRFTIVTENGGQKLKTVFRDRVINLLTRIRYYFPTSLRDPTIRSTESDGVSDIFVGLGRKSN